MFRNYIKSGLCAVTVLFLTLESAQAGFLASILSNGPNTIEDQDRESYVDVNGNDTFDAGDVLVGFVRFDDKTTPTMDNVSLNNRVYSIFTQQVLSVTPDGAGQFDVVFEATTAAGLTLADLTGVATPSGAVSAIYSSATPIANLITTSPGNLVGTGTINLFDYFAAIKAMTLDLVVGFGTGPTQGDDFFEAKTSGTVGAGIATAGGAMDVSIIPNSVTFTNFNAGLSVLVNNDSNVMYNELVVSSKLTLHQIVIGNGAVRGGTGEPNSTEWGNINPDLAYSNTGGFATDADFFINATVVPEPSSMLLLAIGLGACGFAASRRRKNESEA